MSLPQDAREELSRAIEDRYRITKRDFDRLHPINPLYERLEKRLNSIEQAKEWLNAQTRNR